MRQSSWTEEQGDESNRVRPERLRKADGEQGIRLGISRVVEARRRGGNRVQYLDEGRWVVPERVVLGRWRRKDPVNGWRCRGFRLPPATFHAVALCGDPWFWSRAGAEDVKEALARARRSSPPLGCPSPAAVALLVRHVRSHPGALPALLRRHAERRESPGVPDLFLYRESPAGQVVGGRFVEVERPAERLQPSQAEEIAFLREIGLRAGVVRLIEK